MVTNRAALNWFQAPKRFNLWLSENFCLSQTMQESINQKAQITYMGSKIDYPSGPTRRFFIVGLGHFQPGMGQYTWLACKTDISEDVRSHQSNAISRLFFCPWTTHRLIPDHWFYCIQTTSNKRNGHKLRCSEFIPGTKALQFVTLWNFVSHRECRRASIKRHRSHIWGPKLMVRVVPDHDFS